MTCVVLKWFLLGEKNEFEPHPQEILVRNFSFFL